MTQHSPLELYNSRLKDGSLRPDPQQKSALASLQRLYDALTKVPKRRGLWRRKSDAPKGIYMYGGVGRGKSMAMDLFFECVPGTIKKRRVHFHAFMIEVHDYIHSRREYEGIVEDVDDVLLSLAARIAERARILCFDEFHVSDVADAMILGRLFTALFEHGVIVVATSNWPPERLYEGGLQRDRFLPFIELLKTKLEVIRLDGPVDYRAQALREEGSYFYPLGSATDDKINRLFISLAGGGVLNEDLIEVKGRKIPVRSVNGVAFCTFAELCERPHGAEDYLAIAKTYRTVVLDGVPRLGYDRRNEAKRLMILIDALYENRTKLVISADAPPDQLYQGQDHGFDFRRTVSRLLEMQGPKYLENA